MVAQSRLTDPKDRSTGGPRTPVEERLWLGKKNVQDQILAAVEELYPSGHSMAAGAKVFRKSPGVQLISAIWARLMREHPEVAKTIGKT
jgi:hypothetical protein